eukprot:scaffold165429_cov17-Prasinocladus_malaysianus.AAC.1
MFCFSRADSNLIRQVPNIVRRQYSSPTEFFRCCCLMAATTCHGNLHHGGKLEMRTHPSMAAEHAQADQSYDDT